MKIETDCLDPLSKPFFFTPKSGEAPKNQAAPFQHDPKTQQHMSYSTKATMNSFGLKNPSLFWKNQNPWTPERVNCSKSSARTLNKFTSIIKNSPYNFSKFHAGQLDGSNSNTSREGIRKPCNSASQDTIGYEGPESSQWSKKKEKLHDSMSKTSSGQHTKDLVRLFFRGNSNSAKKGSDIMKTVSILEALEEKRRERDYAYRERERLGLEQSRVDVLDEVIRVKNAKICKNEKRLGMLEKENEDLKAKIEMDQVRNDSLQIENKKLTLELKTKNEKTDLIEQENSYLKEQWIEMKLTQEILEQKNRELELQNEKHCMEKKRHDSDLALLSRRLEAAQKDLEEERKVFKKKNKKREETYRFDQSISDLKMGDVLEQLKNALEKIDELKAMRDAEIQSTREEIEKLESKYIEREDRLRRKLKKARSKRGKNGEWSKENYGLEKKHRKGEEKNKTDRSKLEEMEELEDVGRKLQFNLDFLNKIAGMEN